MTFASQLFLLFVVASTALEFYWIGRWDERRQKRSKNDRSEAKTVVLSN